MQDDKQTDVQYPLFVSFKVDHFLGQFTLENSQHVIPLSEKVNDNLLEEKLSVELFELFLLNCISQKTTVKKMAFAGLKADFLIIMEKFMKSFDNISNEEANEKEIGVETQQEIMKKINILEFDNIVLPFISKEGLWNLIIIQNYQQLIKPEFLSKKIKLSASKPQLFYFIFDQMQTLSKVQSGRLLGIIENVLSFFIKNKYEHNESSIFLDQRGLNNSNFNFNTIKLCKLRQSSDSCLMILKILYDLVMGGENCLSDALNTIDFTSYKSDSVIKEMKTILPAQYKDIISKHRIDNTQRINNKFTISSKNDEDKDEVSISQYQTETNNNQDEDVTNFSAILPNHPLIMLDNHARSEEKKKEQIAAQEKDTATTIENEPGVNESFIKKNKITEVPIDFSKIKARNTAGKVTDPATYVKKKLNDDKRLVEGNTAEKRTYTRISQTSRDRNLDYCKISSDLDVPSSMTYTKKKKSNSSSKEQSENVEEFSSNTYVPPKRPHEAIKDELQEEPNNADSQPIIPVKKQKVSNRPPLDLKQAQTNPMKNQNENNNKAKISSSNNHTEVKNDNVILHTENTYNDRLYLSEDLLLLHNQMKKEFNNKGPTVKTKSYKTKGIVIPTDKELLQSIPDQEKKEEKQETCGGCDGNCRTF